MNGHIMVAALWAAATYRVALSLRLETTVWRTAFTTCVLGVAVGATASVYGDQSIDVWSNVWNLALLLTRLALTVAAVAASIYLVTLKQEVVPIAAVRLRLASGAVLAALQILSWAIAPIHDQEIATTAEVNQSSISGCVFAVAFSTGLLLATVEVAHFCYSRAVNGIDPTRTVSLLLTGSACTAGAALFALGSFGVIAHQLVGVETAPISAFLDLALPPVAFVLALGTLSLLLAPPVLDLVESYLRWRSLRRLWSDLVQIRPEVHLDVSPTGGPLTRLHFRLHRAVVEIHDALRVTPVSVPPRAGVRELADALHSVGGPVTAAEVLAQAGPPGDDDGERLIELGRCYMRSRSWSR